jgi:hypothetical protein
MKKSEIKVGRTYVNESGRVVRKVVADGDECSGRFAGARDQDGIRYQVVVTNMRRGYDVAGSGHYFTRSQWALPTEKNYDKLREAFNEKGDGHLRREYEDLRREYEDLRRPFAVTADIPYTDVWTFKTVQSHQGKHVCQKPGDMADHIVRASSREGAVVCDTFAGSGALLMGAARNKRHYIGCDSSELWAKRADFNCKMANAQMGLSL